MHPSFQSVFDKIEAQRKTLLSSLESVSEEQFNQTPGPGKWSLAQVLSHLISSEKLSLLYMQKKVQGIESLKDSGLLEEIKINLLKISQRTPAIKFRAPKVVVNNTKQFHDFVTVRNEWDKVRQDIYTFLDKVPAPLYKRKIYKHPLAGYLNAHQCLTFFGEHILHHTPQIRKLMRAK
ncbi:MAG: DinB family protein [Cyclobacteriaceae bacterium]|nr:DinB family protein [Cyclobacteriaceae bacterium]